MLRCAGIYRSIKRLQELLISRRANIYIKVKREVFPLEFELKTITLNPFFWDKGTLSAETHLPEIHQSVFSFLANHTHSSVQKSPGGQILDFTTHLHHRLGLQCKVRDGNAFMVLSWSHDLVCVFFFLHKFCITQIMKLKNIWHRYKNIVNKLK